jgi:hypothetical protein
MGFNFGAFAGGAAKAGVDTYFRLGEEERRDAEAKRLQELHDAKMAEIQKENELDKAYADTLGRTGTPEAWRTAGGSRGPQEEGAQPALSANPTEAFPTQKLYSRDQAMQDYRNKIMGISATKGAEVLGKMQGLEKGELEIDAYKRAAKKEAAFDTYMNTLKDKIPALRDEVQSELKTNGISGTVTKYGSEFTKLTGHTASVIGNELVIKDAKGKVIERLSDHDDILNGLTDVLGKRIQHNAMQGMLTAGVFTNAKDLQEFFKTQSTIKTQEQTAAAHTMQGQAALQNAATSASIAPSTIALHNAQAGHATAQGALLQQSIELAKNNVAAREAMQPFLDKITQIADPTTPEGKATYEKLVMQAAAAGATKSADIKGLLDSVKKQPKEPKEPITNKDVLDYVKEFGSKPSNEFDKKSGKAIPIDQLPPSKQRAYAEDFYGKGAGTEGAGGLPSDVKPAPRTESTAPAAPAAAIPTKTQSAVVPAAVPASAPMPVKTVAYGKTGYKMPGMLGVYATPEQAQAAWAQKNAPLAPAGRFD